MNHFVQLLFLVGVVGIFPKTPKAQSAISPAYPFKNEIAVNLTSLLRNVLSLSSENVGTPYDLSYRRLKNNHAFRLGLGGATSSDEEVVTINGNFFTRTLRETRVDTRLGYEKIYPVSKKLNLLYGIDVIGGYTLSNSELSGQFNLGIRTITLGGGPALRLEYKLGERVLFMTETTLYASATQRVRNEKDAIGGDTRATTYGYMGALTIPRALFIEIQF